MLKECVKRSDRNAIDILFKQRIEYSDTMSIETVDVEPMVLVKSQPEKLIVKGNLNKVVKELLVAELENSIF
ncbi:MAG: hypothetical protein JWN56_2822 [Sphingobacteriales bacterium]|nr:hypothetical protein [Sphingobacteriales bacterium]